MHIFLIQLPDPVSNLLGTFHARAMARERGDGTWEGWIDFVQPDRGVISYTTPIETHQRDLVTMQRWASGLTHVYAEGALTRARMQGRDAAASQLLFTLEELVEALNRRIPQIDRAGEAKITADANRLRGCSMQRIALLRARDQLVSS